MSYFVTGATGFIGRFLVQDVARDPRPLRAILVREGALPRI